MPILSKQNRLATIVGVTPPPLWEQLGVGETTARENIEHSFPEGVISSPK
jgi:hypothetical protein